MINFDDYTNEKKIKQKTKRPHVPDHLYRILIIGCFGSGNVNASLYLINNQPDIDNIYLHAKDQCEAKYESLTNKRRIRSF